MGDRFIPNRSGSNFDFYYRTRNPRQTPFPYGDAYEESLSTVLFGNRKRVFSFRPPSTPRPKPNENYFDYLESAHKVIASVAAKVRRPRIPTSPYLVMTLADLHDPNGCGCSNLLDWSSRDHLAIALDCSLCVIRDASNIASEVFESDDYEDRLLGLSWAPSGQTIAFGLDNDEGVVHIWDVENWKSILAFETDSLGVGSLAWSGNNLLGTGGYNGVVASYDLRVSPKSNGASVVSKYKAHRCYTGGLKWSDSGTLLASGGADGCIVVWDRRLGSSRGRKRFKDHKAAVRALSWCPSRNNLLASGGGQGDGSIKLWCADGEGKCIQSVETGSEVCGLLWSKDGRELLSSHGSGECTNEMVLWKYEYPSLEQFGKIFGHKAKVLYMAQSPDGSKVASATGEQDQKLRLWDVFAKHNKKQVKESSVPFANVFFDREWRDSAVQTKLRRISQAW